MKDKIRIVLCCIFLTIAVYAGYNIIKIQSEYKKGVDTYKEIDKYTIEQTVAQSSDNTEETVEATEEEKPYPKVDFAGLKAVNGDVIGWIYVPDTEINYPIVHMKNGSMFAALKGYKKQDFFDEHKNGYLITEDAVYRIDFFAGHVANVEENAWQLDFSDGTEFDNWIKSLKEVSAFKSDVNPEYGDKVFTLSTCSYEFDDARFVLSGKLTKIE